jgi:hypothetical protein
MNDADAGLPPSVRAWVRALEGEIPWSDVRPYLAHGVVHNIAGRHTRGAGAIVQMMQGRTAALTGATWLLLPVSEAARWIVRGAIPGKLLPSPGGPMSALDFAFALTSEGLIAEIVPTPHHLQPSDLQAPLDIGARIDSFELATLDGGLVRIDPAMTELLLVMFTCNHCPWALGWHDRLQAVTRDYPPARVTSLQVNPNDSVVSPFDAAGRSLERVAHGAPDADFQDDSLSARWLRDALDAALAGRRPLTAHTTPVGCTIKWSL